MVPPLLGASPLCFPKALSMLTIVLGWSFIWLFFSPSSHALPRGRDGTHVDICRAWVLDHLTFSPCWASPENGCSQKLGLGPSDWLQETLFAYSAPFSAGSLVALAPN